MYILVDVTKILVTLMIEHFAENFADVTPKFSEKSVDHCRDLSNFAKMFRIQESGNATRNSGDFG